MITSKKEYYVILGYIVLGCIAFTTSFSGDSYLNILLATTNNKIFLTIFLYPSFIFLWYFVIKYMNNDYLYLLRVKSRKEYLIKTLMQLFLSTILLYVQFILIELICVNLTNHSDFIISNNLGYNVNDLIVLIASLVRTFLNLLVIGTLAYILLVKKDNKGFGLIILFLLLIIIYFADRLYPIGLSIVDMFNLGFQFYGFDLCNDIYYYIFSNIIFFVFNFSILMVVLFKRYMKIDLGILL